MVGVFGRCGCCHPGVALGCAVEGSWFRVDFDAEGQTCQGPDVAFWDDALPPPSFLSLPLPKKCPVCGFGALGFHPRFAVNVSQFFNCSSFSVVFNFLLCVAPQ